MEASHGTYQFVVPAIRASERFLFEGRIKRRLMQGQIQSAHAQYAPLPVITLITVRKMICRSSQNE